MSLRSKQPEATTARIAIYGGGGFGREVLQLVKDLAAAGARIACAGFLIDAAFRQVELVGNLQVLGDADWLQTDEQVAVAIAIGSPAARSRIAERIERNFGARVVTLSHPRATIGETVSIGTGTIACAGSVATADILIGAYVQLHVNCTIGHDVTIGSFATIAPGANIGGRTAIGEGAFVGSGAVILPRLTIGLWSVIGAGSVVTADVPDNATVAGVPAKIIAQRAPAWHLGSDHQRIEQVYTGASRGRSSIQRS
jgi:sugar O-acyltransferase (sialic acid O-acetyltransferase NeuD family)